MHRLTDPGPASDEISVPALTGMKAELPTNVTVSASSAAQETMMNTVPIIAPTALIAP